MLCILDFLLGLSFRVKPIVTMITATKPLIFFCLNSRNKTVSIPDFFLLNRIVFSCAKRSNGV